MRVLQNSHVLARLSVIERRGERLTALWHGPPPPFAPSEQVAPLVLESDDRLERRDVWLLRSAETDRGDEALEVEFGSERAAPPWHKTGEQSSALDDKHYRAPREEILVVDDDPDIVGLVGETLEEQGWSVRTAGGGREALMKAEQSPPDVAIVDLIMPEVGGGEQLCAALRQNPKFARTRILVLSAAEDTRMVAAACDADSAIVKPFTPELLVHEVRRLMGR